MKKSIMMGAAALMVAGAASAALVGGYDQRLQADDYNTDTGEWADSVSATQNATASGSFGTTTTPGGSTAVVNTGSGTSMSFTRDNAVAGQGYTVQAVIRVDAIGTDNRQGPYALGDGGWSGLYMGASAGGAVNIRGGNQGSGGTDALRIENQTMDVSAGTWGVYTLIFDATATDTITATFDLLSDGSTAFSAVEQNGLSTDVSGILNNGLLFAGEVGQADATGWLGAIADVVVYNSALSTADLAQNKTEFYNVYQIPEPATLGLLGFVGVGLLFIRRRFSI
jgi:hypothetical protein